MAGSSLNTMTELQGTYSVFTGTDIYTVFQEQLISTMQGLSYSITRQKAPVYTMGSPDPRAFARSKRGIAGSMIMTTFDRHCLADFMQGSLFAAKQGSIENSNANPYKKSSEGSFLNRDDIAGTIQASSPNDIDNTLLTDVAASINNSPRNNSMSVVDKPMFTDQLMPFDSTLMGSNEYGISSVMRVFGLEILNEGSGVSIDDTSNEVQMTYIARLISPWVSNQKLTDPAS